VFYESPYRLAAFLEDALAVYGDRQAALANDLTKFYETVQRGMLSDLLAAVGEGKVKGEYVVVIAGADGIALTPPTAVGTPLPTAGRGEELGDAGGDRRGGRQPRGGGV
jgi:16S rRNA C1402 (ribose-2'-O) methylase RsmI